MSATESQPAPDSIAKIVAELRYRIEHLAGTSRGNIVGLKALNAAADRLEKLAAHTSVGRVDDAMVDAAMPWVAQVKYMHRDTDRRNAVRSAIEAALTHTRRESDSGGGV